MMKVIPTTKEPELLRAAYKEAYGEDSYEYQENLLDWLELQLLNDAYYEKFGDYVGTMCLGRSLSELDAEIRKSLETGKPYDDGVPEGALI